MSRYYDRYYDHWERLVGAVIRREQLRQLSLDDSRSPSTRSFDSDFSCFSSNDLSFAPSPSPLHAKLISARDVREGKKSGSRKDTAKKTNIWKGLSIFSGFSSKKEYGKDERDVRWAMSQRTSHGPEPIKINKSIAETARLRELHTFKGHIESALKAKGIDIHSMNHYYTI
ncbi:hypothetical protein BUALT_Bualt06G0096100 [Buddleja alternifolia]|uniref:Uncharacterized protein n=1 Tax=Buddleja alternifolia TaxID=168488 RepID=A0AAV6XE47_9LAMI|nr:hypothetical protein BUALT_Bualt06G0096100 [Buddleja alternifolia]